MKPIDLHLVSWNRPKMTELVIKTIHRNTKRENFRLVVLDNGSSFEQQEMLFKLHEGGKIDELILLNRNIGLEAARQKLLTESTRSDYFICVDNDCLPPPRKKTYDWIDKLVKLMEEYGDFAAISCRPQVMIGTGDIFEEADQVGDDIVEFPHPGGSLRIMRTEAVNAVGGWDREARGRGSEETYIGAKLNEAGYRTAFARNVRTLHLFGTRGPNGTDRWGYSANMYPFETGHRDISHPALTQGDDKKKVSSYAGDYLTREYFK